MKITTISGRVLALMGGIALLVGCAGREYPPPVTWAVVDSVGCTATVEVVTAESARSVTVSAPRTDVLFDTGDWDKRRPTVALPAILGLSWQAPVRRSSEGETRTDTNVRLEASRISFTGRLSGKKWEGPYSGQTHYVACDTQGRWEVDFPVERSIVVTSDPDGATIYRQDDSWATPELLGTAPDTLITLWRHDQYAMGLLFRKSGHQDVRERVEWEERELRAILHPLPHQRPGGH